MADCVESVGRILSSATRLVELITLDSNHAMVFEAQVAQTFLRMCVIQLGEGRFAIFQEVEIPLEDPSVASTLVVPPLNTRD